VQGKTVVHCARCALPSERPRLLRILDWTGCVVGLSGAYLLASAIDFSRYGWVLFLLANFVVIAFAWGIRAYGLLTQQLGFMGSSMLGLFHAFWPHV
jgi:hypothetical protein